MEGTPAVTTTYDTMELEEEEGGTNGHQKKNGTAAGEEEEDAHRDRSVEIWQFSFPHIVRQVLSHCCSLYELNSKKP